MIKALRYLEEEMDDDVERRAQAMEELAQLSRELADHLIATERQLRLTIQHFRTAARIATHRVNELKSRNPDESIGDDLISVKDLVRELGVSRTTLYNMRETRGFPEAVRISTRKIAYRRSEIVKWMELNRKRGRFN